MNSEDGDQKEATSHRTRGARFEHLDMVRGMAALLVLVGHVRGFVFVDYSQLSGPKLIVAPLYVIGGLGHQAVILFFALSGFLVGGRALQAIAAGRWNLPDYAIHRFARLWTALIPALIATALLDWIGRDLLRLDGYDGKYWNMLASGPLHGADTASTIAAFIGNILFLQTIAVPVFGTNGPLWSLANEFWYYFIVPFGWLALAGRGFAVAGRVAAGLFVLLAVVLLTWQLVALGSIWVMGALARIVGDRMRSLDARGVRLLGVAALLALLAGGAASLARPGLITDIALGAACAAALPCLVSLANPGGFYGRLAFWISEISFTLYVVHFPLIALLWFALFAPTQFTIASAGLAAFAGLMAAAIAFATLMWLLFERNTPHVRKFLLRTMGVAPRRGAA